MKKLFSSYLKATSDFWEITIGVNIWFKILAALIVVLMTCIFIVTVIGLVLGIYWVLWKLYLMAMPFWFSNLKTPDYWTFTSTVLLLVYVRNLFWRNNATKNKETD